MQLIYHAAMKIYRFYLLAFTASAILLSSSCAETIYHVEKLKSKKCNDFTFLEEMEGVGFVDATGLPFYLRYQCGNNYIEIGEDLDQRSFGNVYVGLIEEETKHQHDASRCKSTYWMHYVIHPVTRDSLDRIFHRLDSIDFTEFLTGDSIAGYQSEWLDCFDTRLVINKNDEVFQLEYPCLWSQDTSNLVISRLQNALKELMNSVRLNHVRDTLFSYLKPEIGYSTGLMIYTPLSAKSREHFRNHRPKYEYLKSTSDSITRLVSNELNVILEGATEKSRAIIDDNCHVTFYAHFDRKGRCLRLTSNEKDKDSDYRKCRRIANALLKRTDLSINYLYPFSREIDLYSDTIKVSDNTVFFH